MRQEDYQDIEAAQSAAATGDDKKADQHALRFAWRNFLRNVVFFTVGVVITLLLSSLWIGFGYIGFAVYALLTVVEAVRMIFVIASGAFLGITGQESTAGCVATIIQVLETLIYVACTGILYAQLFE